MRPRQADRMAADSPFAGLTVCWLSGTRYACPLDATGARKWQALAGLGAPMIVIGFAPGLRPRIFTQDARFYTLPNLPLSLLRYLEMFILGTALALWAVWRDGAQVMVAQSPDQGAIGAFVKQAARLAGRQVILIVENHGNFEAGIMERGPAFLAGAARRLMRRAVDYALRQADLLRAISSSTRRQLEALAPSLPLVEFMTWTDVSAFTAERTLPLAQTQDLVYAGVLIPRKGVHFLIDAFDRLAGDYPAARLWLVGSPQDPRYAADLRHQAERLGLGDRVIFVGAVSQRELAGYFGRCRAVVLPSTSEGLGRVLVEAMLCGAPAVGSRVGGIPDVVREGETGWLAPPGDVDALAAALRRLLDDPDIEAMGARAQAFARQFFSETAYVDGYRRLLALAQERLAARP